MFLEKCNREIDLTDSAVIFAGRKYFEPDLIFAWIIDKQVNKNNYLRQYGATLNDLKGSPQSYCSVL